MQGSPLSRILNGLAALLFALAAWAQYNDIDPAIYDHPSVVDAAFWLAFYALIAGLFVVILFRRIPNWLFAIALLACLIQLGRTAPGLWENLTGDAPFTLKGKGMSANDPRVELSREFLGALLALLALIPLWWQTRKRKTSR